MKILVALLATLCCSIAFAGTTTLDSESCSPGLCYNVPNDGNLQISYIAFGSSWLDISLNGTTIYDRGGVYPTVTQVPGPNNTTITTYVFEGIVLEEFYGGVPGTTVTLSIVATEIDYPCVRQGRGNSCPIKVTLVDGTLTTP